jgi:hypothetical protein
MTTQVLKLAGADHTMLPDNKLPEAGHKFGEQAHDRLFTSEWLFQAGGDVIALDAWVPSDIIAQIDALNQDESKHLRSRNYAGHYGGNKGGVEYNFVPEGWGLPDHTTTLGSLLYDRGDMLQPHRDKWKSLTPNGTILGDSFRMICHINHTNPTEFTFIVDDKIVSLEPGRWYAINTRRVHYGFSFVDGVYHLSCDLKLEGENLEKSVSWLLDVLPYAQKREDRKGIWCSRN